MYSIFCRSGIKVVSLFPLQRVKYFVPSQLPMLSSGSNTSSPRLPKSTFISTIEKFVETKGVIRCRNSKDRQQNGLTKRDKQTKQWPTKHYTKIKDWSTRATAKPWGKHSRPQNSQKWKHRQRCDFCSFNQNKTYKGMKSFKKPKGLSETVIRRTYNTMTKIKRTNDNLQKNTQKTEDWTTRITWGELRCPGRVSSSCSGSGTFCVTLAKNHVSFFSIKPTILKGRATK